VDVHTLLLGQIDSEWNEGTDYGVVIDGLKNTGEVVVLRGNKEGELICVGSIMEKVNPPKLSEARPPRPPEFRPEINRGALR